jgi:NAD+ synthase (glutamine-hydrolysing)
VRSDLYIFTNCFLHYVSLPGGHIYIRISLRVYKGIWHVFIHQGDHLSMIVYLAQLNPTVGDLNGNCEKIIAALEMAEQSGADLVVTPEMALTGYPPQDLLDRPDFVHAAHESLQRIKARVGNTGLLLGTIWPNEGGRGRGLYNAAVLLQNGGVSSWHAKSLLPTYDVFDEDRYFEPCRQLELAEIKGRKLGVTVCEDFWNDLEIGAHQRYREDPAKKLVDMGADILINLSASPFELGKPLFRSNMLKNTALRFGIPVMQVNQVGGNDGLVFDGGSRVFGADGSLHGCAPSFTESGLLVDIDNPQVCGDEPERTTAAWASDALALGLRDYVLKCGFRRVLLGLSGGIDSALTAALAVRALGPEQVLGVAMPSRYSSEGSVNDARELAQNLGIEFRIIPIEEMFSSFLAGLEPHFEGKAPDTTEENLQARIRGTILMGLSNKLGALLLATGNKSEMATGYCTLYGDMCGGLAVLADAPKQLVYEMARWLNHDGVVIPISTIEKPPSAELKPDQTDQDSLPPYDVVDKVLSAYLEDHKSIDEMISSGLNRDQVIDVVCRVEGSEYKRRQSATGLKITCKAFGSGRRMPIAAHTNPEKWNPPSL